MLEQVHKHIISELQQNTRTDIIFIITAIFLNLLALGINAATAERSQARRYQPTYCNNRTS